MTKEDFNNKNPIGGKMSKTDTLYYHGNLSEQTVARMKEYRLATIKLSTLLESFGESRELSLAFTHLESAQMYVNKHLCWVDPQAVKELIE
jgi:hypothetical protein